MEPELIASVLRAVEAVLGDNLAPLASVDDSLSKDESVKSVRARLESRGVLFVCVDVPDVRLGQSPPLSAQAVFAAPTESFLGLDPPSDSDRSEMNKSLFADSIGKRLTVAGTERNVSVKGVEASRLCASLSAGSIAWVEPVLLSLSEDYRRLAQADGTDTDFPSSVGGTAAMVESAAVTHGAGAASEVDFSGVFSSSHCILWTDTWRLLVDAERRQHEILSRKALYRLANQITTYFGKKAKFPPAVPHLGEAVLRLLQCEDILAQLQSIQAYYSASLVIRSSVRWPHSSLLLCVPEHANVLRQATRFGNDLLSKRIAWNDSSLREFLLPFKVRARKTLESLPHLDIVPNEPDEAMFHEWLLSLRLRLLSLKE